MIQIDDKRNCSGCGACSQRCPQQCISMREDAKGFLYPFIADDKCVSCGICEEICPFTSPPQKSIPLTVETSINPNQFIRQQSSSGGIFSGLADLALNEGGIVFGARFNDQWEVVFDYTETEEGLSAFRGSKYLQGTIGDSYIKAESFLKSGRKVLFSGTPCQIAGLTGFLQKHYDNLITIAIACHSIPSPLIWKEYLKGLNLNNIQDIQFRDKRFGWERYGLCIKYDNGKEFFLNHNDNPYMQLFLHGIITRPSCFNCIAKNNMGGADIVIGDCWGISKILPDFTNDHKGISFVICQSEKGLNAISSSGLRGQTILFDKVSEYNGGLSKREYIPEAYDVFWKEFITRDNKKKTISKYAKPYLPNFKKKAKQVIRHFFNCIIPK